MTYLTHPKFLAWRVRLCLRVCLSFFEEANRLLVLYARTPAAGSSNKLGHAVWQRAYEWAFMNECSDVTWVICDRPTTDDALLYYNWMGDASRARLAGYHHAHTAMNHSVIFNWLMGDLFYVLTGWIAVTCVSDFAYLFACCRSYSLILCLVTCNRPVVLKLFVAVCLSVRRTDRPSVSHP